HHDDRRHVRFLVRRDLELDVHLPDRDLIRRHHLVRSLDGGVWSDLWNAADEEAALVFDDQRPLEELASSGFLRLQRDDGTSDDEGSPQITAEHQTLPLWKAEGYARSVRLSNCQSVDPSQTAVRGAD